MADPDYSTWLPKQQAADAIGVTTKTVETMTKAGQLQQALWRRPTGGPALAVYHPEDVARLAQERHPAAAPFVVPADTAPATRNGNGHAALSRREPSQDVSLVPVGDDVLRAVLAAAVRAVTSESSQKSPPLWVDLDEAARLTGLTRRRLLKCIREGKLEAWWDAGQRRVRRRDLEQL